ncbi:HAD family hydrolase [Actinokineospora spheciospongiae]|uniref:HAD family hydrolase n=1 Tax=Actinokineospora spheciospongiae TaxID=909613 RepID=UPI001376CCED|nr:HAD-IA family hydrolase [Actinokineospora spheciospongiae]
MDPFEILSYAVSDAAVDAAAVEGELARLEQLAVVSAEETFGVREFISEWKLQGIPFAIVSNNSTKAIRKYINAHNLTDSISLIAGRTPECADRLKPDPHLIEEALNEMNCNPQEAVFIGDSISDMIAGWRAGVVRVAFANKTGKDATLGPLSDLVIERFGN